MGGVIAPTISPWIRHCVIMRYYFDALTRGQPTCMNNFTPGPKVFKGDDGTTFTPPPAPIRRNSTNGSAPEGTPLTSALRVAAWPAVVPGPAFIILGRTWSGSTHIHCKPHSHRPNRCPSADRYCLNLRPPRHCLTAVRNKLGLLLSRH